MVGHDPLLFDYFLPERWRRTPRQSMSDSAQVYHTKTKDGIELVWKVSHVGDTPATAEPDGLGPGPNGYNSPFEEFAYAFQLTAAGVPTTYPRAIYMLGHRSTLPPEILDQRRYESHQHLSQPDGTPILQRERNYISIWGYWNGLDEVLAREDRIHPHCRGINADQARDQGHITPDEYDACYENMTRLLASAGLESPQLLGTHYLLTLLPDKTIQRNPAVSAARRMDSATCCSVASGKPSSRIKPAVRMRGRAPAMSKSFTDPLTASEPMSPPGKKRGWTT